MLICSHPPENRHKLYTYNSHFYCSQQLLSGEFLRLETSTVAQPQDLLSTKRFSPAAGPSLHASVVIMAWILSFLAAGRDIASALPVSNRLCNFLLGESTDQWSMAEPLLVWCWPLLRRQKVLNQLAKVSNSTAMPEGCYCLQEELRPKLHGLHLGQARLQGLFLLFVSVISKVSGG